LERQADAIAPEAQKRLKRLARSRPREAEACLARALALREALHRILDRLRRRETPTQGDLAILNAELAQAPARTSLVAGRGAVAWRAAKGDRLDLVLGPLVWSAADLIASRRAERVKQCLGEGCGWLFLDESRAMNRLWCSMELCGNRAKAKRHYERSRRVD
jgi:predicted RNA-binding Zn ribbon-like protein